MFKKATLIGITTVRKDNKEYFLGHFLISAPDVHQDNHVGDLVFSCFLQNPGKIGSIFIAHGSRGQWAVESIDQFKEIL